ncbi:MAG TPA: DmsE family decaheme c-type cytochrome [Pyrinomonadaceae bacterium]|nr:DmsE family decaheme c-type cytochrome [Pyrinomonadaceae bacterium]
MLTKIKLAILGGSVLALVWFGSGTLPESALATKSDPPKSAKALNDDYVGSETCKNCHEEQFQNYSHTVHAKLPTLSSWKGKASGCEGCHGPGRAHVEGDGDKTKILTFLGKPAKETSETCLTCHAGREEHNNFRRGEHWRQDIGCTDCHTAHAVTAGANKANSNAFVSPANAEKPGFATEKLLAKAEPQLCMGCHSETKHQFNMPFHHKVLEGAMRCSDCHNPHGGFETKQARLTTGADAACIKCHTDKQGPFAYEHAPIKTEGCAACHNPHGSPNARLLKTSAVSQLCLECHSQDHGVGAQEPAGPGHNLAAQYRDCTACHVKIHGSHTSHVFFR